jgi:hypothetical protein
MACKHKAYFSVSCERHCLMGCFSCKIEIRACFYCLIQVSSCSAAAYGNRGNFALAGWKNSDTAANLILQESCHLMDIHGFYFPDKADQRAFIP